MIASPAPYRAQAIHLGVAVSRFRLIGLLQVAGAAGLVIGLDQPWLGALAAACLAALTAGAVVMHRRAGDALTAYVGALGCAVASVVAVAIFVQR